MFDENFVPVDVLYSPDALSNLEPGEYNVGILMEEKSQFSDEYIAMYGREASYGSWLGIFQLKVE
jgi:hypothetical protein